MKTIGRVINAFLHEMGLHLSRLRPEQAGGNCNLPTPGSPTTLVVPLDHELAVTTRPGDYVYPSIRRLFDEHLPAMREFLDHVRPRMYHDNLSAVPRDRASDTGPFWNNGFFSADDARSAYGIAAWSNPRSIVEVGSGNSTKFFRKAISDFGLRSRLVCIDPYPRTDISKVADQIHRQSFLDTDASLVSGLQPGDIFFLDGSHLVLGGTDVTHFMLNLLPVIPEGVFVHIHDITLPFDYSAIPEFIPRYYSEQYLVAALLLNSNVWKPLLPVYYLARNNLLKGGTSLWMCKGSWQAAT